MTVVWKKAYKGPFSKREAEVIAGELRERMNPVKDDIHDVKVLLRKMHTDEHDVYIKTSI